MPASVGVNKMSVVHQSSNGVTTAFPDVCKTPTPVGPVPIPYPNVAMSSDTDKGSQSVKCDGNPICLEDSNFRMSSGDEAGSAGGGVVSNKIKGKAEFVNYSFDVKVEGKGVARAMDLMLHNDKNTPPFPLIQGPVVPVPPPPKPVCDICDEAFNG
jgi:Toxin PAAR-like domain